MLSNSRTRGLLPPDPRRFGQLPLDAGDISVVVRIRGPADALRAFAALTAAERGALVVSMPPPPT